MMDHLEKTRCCINVNEQWSKVDHSLWRHHSLSLFEPSTLNHLRTIHPFRTISEPSGPIIVTRWWLLITTDYFHHSSSNDSWWCCRDPHEEHQRCQTTASNRRGGLDPSQLSTRGVWQTGRLEWRRSVWISESRRTKSEILHGGRQGQPHLWSCPLTGCEKSSCSAVDWVSHIGKKKQNTPFSSSRFTGSKIDWLIPSADWSSIRCWTAAIKNRTTSVAFVTTAVAGCAVSPLSFKVDSFTRGNEKVIQIVPSVISISLWDQ